MISSRRKLWTQKILKKNPRKKLPIVIKMEKFEGCVLGVDPSLRGSGFAVIQMDSERKMQLLESKTLRLTQRYTFTDCLGEIFKTSQYFLKKYPIKTVSLEQTIYVQNSRTAQILGSSRGALLAAVSLEHLSANEYAPLRIKKAVTGIGQATKAQVASMVQALLNLEKPLPPDESDACAAAICHLFSLKSLIA